MLRTIELERPDWMNGGRHHSCVLWFVRLQMAFAAATIITFFVDWMSV